MPKNRATRLSHERNEKYDRLESLVGNTPLGEIKHIPVPGGNRIFFKEEYKNPTGSHYDRGWIRLLRALEEEGSIQPGVTPLVETTTGNSGAAFAWMCRILGYECAVFIPADMPRARIEQIRAYGATVYLSPAGEYIEGLLGSFRSFREEHREYFPTNHSADEVHLLSAMNDLGREIVADLDSLGVRKVDYFVSALGNGSTTRGVGVILLGQGASIIGVEPVESPTILQQTFPDRFARNFQDVSQSGQHGLIGTGPGVVAFKFPNMSAIMPQIQDIITLSREEWEPRLKDLADLEGQFVGNTSAACLAAALKIAEKESGKVFVMLFYDPAWKYLN